MLKFLNLFSIFFNDAGEKEKFSKVVAPSFIIHFFAAILSVALWLTLTRTLGSKEYGIYTFVFSIVFLLVNLSTYGINILAVREIPALVSTKKLGLAKGFYNWSSRLILIICPALLLLSAGFIAIFTYCLHLVKETDYTLPTLFACTAIPFSGLMNFYTSTLRGRHKTVLSLLPDNIIKPIVFLLCVFALLGFKGLLTLQNAILLTSFSFLIASVYSFIVNRKAAIAGNIQAEYDTSSWRRSLKSVFLLTVLLNLNARIDILMVGFLRNSSDVGVYSIADNLASKLTFFLTLMNLISAAAIARLHSLNETKKLQKLITKISRWVMLASIPGFIVVFLWGRWLLSFFGHEFEQGQTALIIISIGQLINIAFGPVGNLAIMTGNEKYNIYFLSIRVLVFIILNLILTPSLGINGTAIAVTVCMIAGNAGMFFVIKKKTGVKSWIFG